MDVALLPHCSRVQGSIRSSGYCLRGVSVHVHPCEVFMNTYMNIKLKSNISINMSVQRCVMHFPPSFIHRY